MLALFSFLIIIFLSLFIVRIGAIALEATGISKDVSEFESLSAFSGVGFTTKESEIIMGSSVRRKIIRVLMILGSAGLTTGVATLILTFLNDSGSRNIYDVTISSFTFNFVVIGEMLEVFSKEDCCEKTYGRLEDDLPKEVIARELLKKT